MEAEPRATILAFFSALAVELKTIKHAPVNVRARKNTYCAVASSLSIRYARMTTRKGDARLAAAYVDSGQNITAEYMIRFPILP